MRLIRPFVLISIAAFLALGVALAESDSDMAPASTYRVRGVVVSKADGRFLAKARVLLTDVKNPRNVRWVLTSEDGTFEFSGLAAGKYSLQGAKTGFLTTAYEQHAQFSTAIVTGAGLDTEHLTLRLSPAAVLAGKVLDETGEPVRRGNVALFQRLEEQGVERIREYRVDSTNDLGAYEFAPLAPGTYFLRVTAAPWYALHPMNQADATTAMNQDRAFDVAYPATYYGDTSDPDRAAPIALRDGDRVEADIHLTPVPALHLLFHGLDSGTQGFPMLRPSGLGNEIEAEPVSGQTRMVSPGTWEISGIPAGKYNVVVPGGKPGEAPEIREINLVNDAQELELNTSAHVQLSTVHIVSMHVIGQKALPSGLFLFFRSQTGTNRGLVPVSSKGDAAMAEVSPGAYEILAGAPLKAYSVVSIEAGSRDIPGHKINLPPGGVELSLTLVEGTARVEGVVENKGKPAAGAMVVLVPEDPEGNQDRIRRDQSDLDGTFVLNLVVPGKYTAVAIDQGWDLDWSAPGVLAAYLGHGQPVEVKALRAGPLPLPTPLELQAK